MPCRGVDRGLEENIDSVLRQDYPNYEVAVITDTAKDPAFPIAESVLKRNPKTKATLYVSEQRPTCSGKVAALLTALDKTRGRADVYAFIDSDGMVNPNWLMEMVDPLADSSIGATTGFRWYFPSKDDFWSYVESAWNAAGTSIMFNERFNFPWGGATAIRTQTLMEIDIKEAWSNAVSDDIALTLALRRNGYRIRFLPQCIAATHNQTTRPRFLEWAIRQTALTKVLNQGLWRYALAAYGFLDLAFLLGATSLALAVFIEKSWLIPATLLLGPSVFGMLNGKQRCATFRQAVPHFDRQFEKTCVREALAGFVVPWIMVYCIIKSASVREIEWRGRNYPLNKKNALTQP